MKKVKAWWDEIGLNHLLCVSVVDEFGDDVPDELRAGWTRDSLPYLKELAQKMGYEIWDDDQGVPL